jgi:riboflavin biosynthesis pyrimidine reductase
MRPYIICHMGTSIDGRLHPSRFTSPAKGISRDVLRGHYERIHDQFDADGWIVGRRTMSEMAKGAERLLKDALKFAREPNIGRRNGRKLAIGIDPLGRVHYGKDDVGGDHVVAILGEHVSDAYLAELREDGVSYAFAGPRAMTCPTPWKRSVCYLASRRFFLKAVARSTARFLSMG